ncbi:MAG: hypothetical protein HC802_03575, partial [Caldilineaceae bacterium]|nr:hypothetical protein [Caldilineaceae bacterium]
MRDFAYFIRASLLLGALIFLQPSSVRASTVSSSLSQPAAIGLQNTEPSSLRTALLLQQTQTISTTATPLPALVAPIGLISPTIAISLPVTVEVTATPTVETPSSESSATSGEAVTLTVQPLTPSADVSTTQLISEPLGTPLSSEAPGAPEAAAPSPTPTPDPSLLDAAYAGVLEGTIVANRTEWNVTFFVDGVTYNLAPMRSLGLQLARLSTVMSLYNCDANTPVDNESCFWDPYLFEQEGFYEVVNGAEVGGPISLVLQEAGSPPTNQVWIQNRTGERELLVFEGQTYELPPSAVQEFALPGDAPALIHLRGCIEVGDESRCEWSPQSVESGVYYGLVELVSAGGLPNSQITTLELRPVIDDEGTTVEGPVQLLCRLQVPAVNVRSGPGLQYLIIAKIRGAENEPASVLVNGRDEVGQWLTVDERIATGGWVTGSTSFIVC